MKKAGILILLLALLLALLLSACGSQTPPTHYVCARVEARGVALEPEELYGAVPELTLWENGKGTLTLGEDGGELRWTQEGETLTLTVDGQERQATLRDGVLTLTLAGSGTVLTFLAAGATLPPEWSAEDEGRWCRSWYGWWRIEHSEGRLPDTWCDCCAVIAPDEEGRLILTLWDEGGSRAEPMAQVRLRPDGTDALSLGGYFWFDSVEAGAWRLTQDEVGTVLLSSAHHDAGGERFDYTLMLRPWGQDWAGIAENQRPFWYEDWYLPLLRDGAAMPDRIKTD